MMKMPYRDEPRSGNPRGAARLGARRGRGSAENPAGRFEPSRLEPDLEQWDTSDEEPSPNTRFFKSAPRTVISFNDSPDVGMTASFNPYRGCEHGCVYCYARPTHEYFGFSAGLDFETKILYKEDAPDLLRKQLLSRKWKPQAVAFSGVTDCYQPAERKFRLTRRSLEVMADFMNPVCVITKSFLVTRDIDVLSRLAEKKAAAVILSITTLDPKLQRVLEPRASHPKRRLEAIELLTRAGIPTGVNVAPVIPGLTDHEIPDLLKAAGSAGAAFAGYIPVRLPYGVKDLFEVWLGRHFPDRKEKVLNRIRSIRGGKLNDSEFHARMEGKGLFADQIAALFETGRRRAGIPEQGPRLSAVSFRRPAPPDLFESAGH